MNKPCKDGVLNNGIQFDKNLFYGFIFGVIELFYLYLYPSEKKDCIELVNFIEKYRKNQTIENKFEIMDHIQLFYKQTLSSEDYFDKFRYENMKELKSKTDFLLNKDNEQK